MSLRKEIYQQLATTAWPEQGLSPVNKLIATIIIISLVAVALQTEPKFYRPWHAQFLLLDHVIGWLFLIEYALRLWAMGEDPDYKGLGGRLKYIFTIRSTLDLLAILPFVLGMVGSDIFVLRLFRLLRMYTLASLGSFSQALKHIDNAVTERYYELLVSFSIAMIVIFLSSTAMYLIEGPIQPQAFGSIPRAIWWGLSVLTGVGYGDVVPITAAGKICSAITAVTCIGLVAMPTGILAAAFSDAFQRHREGIKPKPHKLR